MAPVVANVAPAGRQYTFGPAGAATANAADPGSTDRPTYTLDAVEFRCRRGRGVARLAGRDYPKSYVRSSMALAFGKGLLRLPSELGSNGTIRAHCSSLRT